MDPQHDQAPIEAWLVEPDLETSGLPRDPSSSSGQLVQNKAVVLGILFGVTGVLGIPLLWINKKFTFAERIVWSIVVTIYTVILIAAAAAVCIWSYRQIFGII